MVNAFSFACTACGKCCNSPPAMALPELFRHRDRFIGCLAIGRAPRRRVGERLRVGQREAVLDEADIAAFDSIADRLLYRTGDIFSIMTQGYDYPSLARCPALADDGRCTLHLNDKPVTCEVVPLDPLVPDTLQHLLLAGRNQSAAYLGTDCIQEGERADAVLMTAESEIKDANATDALARRRRALNVQNRFLAHRCLPWKWKAARPLLYHLSKPISLARIGNQKIRQSCESSSGTNFSISFSVNGRCIHASSVICCDFFISSAKTAVCCLAKSRS
ncbi:hypothetical protein B0G71_5603 [Paraburkholderia sp. BL27I4N3]|nr:hypothetical protein B0G71_5603 [Paraburkholderia sp. BL27I4N3]